MRLARRLLSGLVLLGALGLAPALAADPATALLHTLIDAEDQRRHDDRVFVAAFSSPDPAIRAQAATALGRIGHPDSVQTLASALVDPIPLVRQRAAFALGLIGGEAALRVLHERLATERDGATSQQLLLALGRAGGAPELAALATGLEDRRPLVQQGAAQGLGFLFLRSDASLEVPAAVLASLTTLAARSGGAATPAAFALARYKGALDEAQGAAVLAALRAAPVVEARAFLARVVAKLRTADADLALLELAASPHLSLRVEAMRALGRAPTDGARLAALRAALSDASSQVVVQALQSIGLLAKDAAPLASIVESIARAHASIWIQANALEALVALNADAARKVALGALVGADRTLKLTALRVLGRVGDLPALWAVLPYLASSDVALATVASEALQSFPADTLEGEARAKALDALQRGDAAITALVGELAATHGWREFAAPLAALYDTFAADELEGRIGVLDALAKIGDASHVPLVERALGADDRLVALAAARAYEALTGVDVSSRVPYASRVRGVTPPLAEIRAAARARVTLETTRGRVVLQMLPEAPLVALNFVKLAREGFYDGKTFHRVVPHFVAQGGDPRGDGWGGPGHLVRDAVSPLSHVRGTVGMATAGKDTAGSQLFVNHGSNLHLDGNYTIFARVLGTMDVVDRIEVGDRILRAIVH